MRVPVGDFKMGRKEKAYLYEVIKSNRISYGPYSQRFEAAFAKAHDSKYAVFCNSGTSALHIALAALKEKYQWHDGDEVIVPSVTFVATANVVLHNNLSPVFADVDPLTYNIDPAQIAAKRTWKTVAVIPVHLMGLPADMDKILEASKGLNIVEDACEAAGAQYKGRQVGSFGDIGCFSTYLAHHIVAGVGGLATTSNDDLAIRLKSLMNHGRDSVYLHPEDSNKSGKQLYDIVARRFKFTSVGHSFRATEFEAALGLAQLENLDNSTCRRRAVALKLSLGLSQLSDILQLPQDPDSSHVYLGYPILVKRGSKRELVNFLEDNGIETRDLMPLINQPIYRALYGNLDKECPIAAKINKTGFYIGCHQYLTNEDVDHAIKTIYRFFKRRP